VEDILIADSFRFVSHHDIELGLPRQEIEGFVVGPAESASQPLPLIITIPGYGQTADSEYFREKLNRYLAERYGCLVMSVNYHGVKKVPEPFDFSQLAGLLADLRDSYGWNPVSAKSLQDAISEFVVWASARGVKRLPISMKRFLRFTYPEYLSFGFLPAIDHFIAIRELARRYRFDQRRIVLFGSSYGGYIANLMSKYAPNTFSLVIDNSGLARVLLRDVLSGELLDGEQGREISYGNDKVVFPFSPSYPWTLNEQSPAYFSDARRSIRSLLHAGQWMPSGTRHCIFHSLADELVPIAEKDRLVEILRGVGRSVNYHRIEASDIDGKIFKTTSHGMDASLRSLFEIAVPDTIPRLDTMTDYERRSRASFSCGSETYQFDYAKEFDFRVQLQTNPHTLDLIHTETAG
jgi:pimeloyl-ACP methyl ester carboxylesterase